jgi:hypothetical protein
MRMGPDAHQFVTTARVRAHETLAKTGVGRGCILDEMTAVVTITFDYPSKFRNLVTSADLAGFERAGLTGRSVSFSTALSDQGPLGRIVFSRAGKPPLDFLIKPELGADALAHRVVEFMGRGIEPTFPASMVVAPDPEG